MRRQGLRRRQIRDRRTILRAVSVNPSFCADGFNLQENGLDDPDQTVYENFASSAERNYTDYCNRELEFGDSEKILGRAINDFARRDEVVIATKVYGRMRPGPNGAGLSRKAIFAEIDNSLHRLGMDYVDLCAGRGTDGSNPAP